MFFKKKYHTLKIEHKKFNSLKKSLVFTHQDIDEVIDVVNWFSNHEDWKLNIMLNKKDAGMPLKKTLVLYNKVFNKELEEIPYGITNLQELCYYLDI